VEFLDALGRELGISFRIEDETGYATHRDFMAMKRQMVDWLRSMFIQIFQNAADGYINNCICWDISSYIPGSKTGFITPCGLLDPALVAHYLDNMQVEQLCNLFWVWNNEERDAYF
jgi:hypothetical protein